MGLRKFGCFIVWFSMTFMVFLATINVSYAYIIFPVPLNGRTIWHNPFTGQSVELPKGSAYSIQIPGLQWKFYGNTNVGRTRFRFIFRYQYNFYPQRSWWGTEVVEAFSLKTDSVRRELCGQQIITGKAVGDRGEVYDVVKFFSAFEKDKEELAVMAVFDVNKNAYISMDETIFCPLVASFFPQERQFFIPPSGEWVNPLSEKTFVLPPQARVAVENIVANNYGSYQAYRVTNGPVRVSLQKILHNNHVVYPDELDKMSLPKNAVFHWKGTGYGLGTFEKAGFSKREAKFTGRTAEGIEIQGFAFDYQKQGERIVVRAWRPDGKALTADERNWVMKLFDSSIPD